MYDNTCMLDYEGFMTRYIPPPVDEHEPEELFTWTPTKPIRPGNPRDKGVSHIEVTFMTLDMTGLPGKLHQRMAEKR